MNKILVATDGSESASAAVELGVSLAAQHKAELIFVHVVPAVDVVPGAWFGVGSAFPHEACPKIERCSRMRRRSRRSKASSRPRCC